MEWFGDNPEIGRNAAMLLALAIAATGLWLGRKRLHLAIPGALVFLVLAAIAIPSMVGARQAVQQNRCINNLRAIHDAKGEWARINNKPSDAVPTQEDLYGKEGTNRFLRHPVSCPRGGNYTFGAVTQPPACSFSEKGHRIK